MARIALGDLDTARDHFEEAREVFEAIGFEGHIGYAFQGVACAAAAQGHFIQGAGLLGRAQLHLDRAGWATDVFASELLADAESRAREALGDAAFEAAYADGLAAD